MIRSRRSTLLLRWSISSALIAILGVLVVIPFLTIVLTSLTTALPFSGNKNIAWTLSNYAALWSDETARALANTLIISVCGTIVAMAIGCGLAWLAARTDVPLKSLVYAIGVAPLFMSLVVAAVTWSFIGSGRTGYLNIIMDSLGIPIHIEMQSLWGITFVHGLYYVPYPFLFLYNALTLVHPDLEEAAAVHGGDLPRILRRVTFPLVKPALVGAGLLIFVAAIEEFPGRSILGGPVGIDTLSVRIYNLFTRVPGDPNQAGAVSILLTAIVCMLVFTQRRVLRGRDFRTVTGKGMQRRLIPLRAFRWPAFVLAALYGFVAIGLPMLGLLEGAFRSTLYVPDAASLFDVNQMSLRHLSAALASAPVRDGFLNSLIAALSTAVFAGSLYFVTAYVAGRTNLPGRRLLEYLAMTPLALPALVMGLGILWTWLASPIAIYGTMAIFVVAFTTRFMPQGYRTISSCIGQIHDDLEEAAMVVGASRFTAVCRITLPLMRVAIVSSALLTIILSMRELTLSLFLYTTRTRVLSIVIFEAYDNGNWAMVASISLIYTVVLAAIMMIGRRWMQTSV